MKEEKMRLYKAQEVASILHVHPKTVWAWGRSGILNTVRVGRTVRFVLPSEVNYEEK